MNDDYCLNNDDTINSANDTRYWYQKIWNPKGFVQYRAMFIVCIILFIFLTIVIYWNYFRPKWCKKIYQKLLKFEGFKYSHLSRETTHEAFRGGASLTNTNCPFLIYGSSGSGKTSFLKHYLARTPRTYVVFGQNENEFPASNFVPCYS